MTKLKTCDGQQYEVFAKVRTALGMYLSVSKPVISPNGAIATFTGAHKSDYRETCDAPHHCEVSQPFVIENDLVTAGLPS